MTDRRSIGFVGTGIMGFHMARRLAEAGHRVTAWNRTRAKAEPLKSFGASVVGEAGATGQGADAVIVMVTDGPASDEVISGTADKGLLDTMSRGAALIVMSSIPVETAQGHAEAAAKRGLVYMDAPVSGGEGGARDGRLVIMAGGARADFDRLAPVFAPMGRATLVGPAGAGSLAKLANQVIVGNTICTVAEALLLVEKGGGDPAAVIAALTGGFADSPIFQNHGRRMLERNFRPGGTARIQLKDTGTATALAQKLGLDMPVTSRVRDIYAGAVEHGLQDHDHSAAYLELRRRNGLGD